MTIDLTSIANAVIALIAAIITAFVIPWIRSKTTAAQFEKIKMWVTVAVEAAEQLYTGSGRGAGYSPAAVVGEIKRLGLTFKTEISEKTIYNYIDKGIFYGISRESLPEHGERKRKYDKVERKKAARAPQGESIEERPQEINDRQTFGHWEGDCVCGKKRTKETLFVLSERLTRNEIIIKMPDQTAASVVAALNKLERRFGKKFSQIFKSITFDNGSEFMDCAGIEKSVYGKDRKRTKVYYCHPYSAYERGTNENINKMIRRFLPKGTDFRKVTAAYIQRVETWINNYPREILGFETSGSLFERYVAEAA